MSEQEKASLSSSRVSGASVSWWIQLFRWLRKLLEFLGVSVVLALVVNIVSTWLITPKGALPDNTPLSTAMRHWPLVLLVGVSLFLLAVFFWTISRKNISAQAISSPLTLQERKHMLGRLHFLYKQMFDQSLQEVVQVELDLTSRPAAVQNAAHLLVRSSNQLDKPFPPHTSIVDAYQQSKQELLILGEPGAGKSTLLLELAYHLVQQAEQDTMHLLPILLPLSSWASKKPDLQKWLSEQFALLYDVPRGLSQQWIQANQLMFLLDGLDEMDASARSACISAINAYHREHVHPLVVCSRTNEFETSSTHERLALNSAIVVQPLSVEQVDTSLVNMGEPLTALRAALQKNTVL